jgi:hypothetical protein
MDLRSTALLLQLALCLYGAGIVASLLALRTERIANLLAFDCATLAAVAGIGAGVLGLTSGAGDSLWFRSAFWISPLILALWTRGRCRRYSH